jgi:hypothetical protein
MATYLHHQVRDRETIRRSVEVQETRDLSVLPFDFISPKPRGASTVGITLTVVHNQVATGASGISSAFTGE